MAAFDALFLTKWYTPKIMRYFFAVMAHDASRTVRRHVARNACHSLALLFTMGELKAAAKDADALLIEEDGSGAPDRAKEAKKSEVDQMIRAFRKDRELGKSEVLREFLMPLAL
jgi:transcription initiation factor TFIID subunit 2